MDKELLTRIEYCLKYVALPNVARETIELCKAALSEPVASVPQDGWTFDELDLRGPADFETTPPEGWESSDWRTCLELKAEIHNKKVYRAEIKRLRALIANQVPQDVEPVARVREDTAGGNPGLAKHVEWLPHNQSVMPGDDLYLHPQIIAPDVDEFIAAAGECRDSAHRKYFVATGEICTCPKHIAAHQIRAWMAGHARVKTDSVMLSMPEGWSFRKTQIDKVGGFGFIISKEGADVRSSTAIFQDEDGLIEQFLFAVLTASKESGQ